MSDEKASTILQRRGDGRTGRGAPGPTVRGARKDDVMSGTPANDLSRDEPDSSLVAEVANYVRQNREGKRLDAWDWGTCTQNDVDTARRIVAAAHRRLRPADDEEDR